MVNTPQTPGLVLTIRMAEIGVSNRVLAQRMGIRPEVISKIKNGRSGITANTALLLEKHLGGTPEETAEYWITLSACHEVATLRRRRKGGSES